MAPSNTAVRIPPRISASGTTFATVIVDQESVRFVVHEELLTYHSPFFRAALNGRFEEATTKEVRLEEVDKDTFEFFVHWLYHQRLPNEHDDPDLLELWVGAGSLVHINLVCLHAFCEKYDVSALKWLCMDSIFEISGGEHADLSCILATKYAFTTLPEDSPMCRLLVHLYCDRSNTAFWDSAWDYPKWEPPAAFLKLVLKRYSEISHHDRPTRAPLEICDYHEYKDNEEKEACAAKRAA